MRLFLAINFPLSVRQSLWKAAAPLRDAAPSVKWTPVERLHLTVRFLGERSDEEADRIARIAAPVAERHAPMDVTLRGIGAFPNPRRPRVIWVGVEASPRLELLAHELEEALGSLGIDPEGRPFRPHLTLARVREDEQRDASRAIRQAQKDFAFEQSAEIESLELMRSHLGANARYEVKESFRLAREVPDARMR